MPKIELWNNEAHAIDMACMNLMETVRRGRQKQEACVEEGDPDGAAFLEDGIAGLEQARLALRNLLARAGWTAEIFDRIEYLTESEVRAVRRNDTVDLRFIRQMLGDMRDILRKLEAAYTND